MKTMLIALVSACCLLGFLAAAPAADTSAAQDDLKALVTKIKAKLQEGKKTEADMAPELKEFDELLAKHKDEKTDEVSQILFMKAQLYLEVFENTDKGVELVKQLKSDFPDTKLGKNADDILDSIKKQQESKKVQKALVKGSKFPDFDEKDIAGKPVSIANYKGKVVLVDFWATWCGPCVHELPNVVKAYEKNHSKGFEIIGISLDQDKEKLTSFTKEKNMTWQQFFDGKGWGNKLAVKYGVQSIPATYLLDGEGKIIGKDLRGEELVAAVEKAVAKN
ncbi:MAG TPA: TlpA disulfide reductase family protein [Candidatus Limnocylindrales bacterium]|jgi:peroxiredoxin|nr:TlpA disulfide reductase family protein [Candidatus Limnocylindrales bacterium]